jgi:hypothetical protein
MSTVGSEFDDIDAGAEVEVEDSAGVSLDNPGDAVGFTLRTGSSNFCNFPILSLN